MRKEGSACGTAANRIAAEADVRRGQARPALGGSAAGVIRGECCGSPPQTEVSVTRGRHGPPSVGSAPWAGPGRQERQDTQAEMSDLMGRVLKAHPPLHLVAVENELNTRPRLVLNDRTPADLFDALLASTDPTVLRR